MTPRARNSATRARAGWIRKSTLEILRALNREDARVAPAVRRVLPQIARAVDAIVASFRRRRPPYLRRRRNQRPAGGARCGGMPADVWHAATDGAGDDRRRREGAARRGGGRGGFRGEWRARFGQGRGYREMWWWASPRAGPRPTCSARLKLAQAAGRVTVAVTSNPRSPLARAAQIAIAPDTGPEAIAGSTRMKAGTAQKMVLNMLSTAAMVRLGRVYENWMINVALTNQKLRRRGARILEEAAGVSASTAEHALRQTGHELPAALVMLKTGANAHGGAAIATADRAATCDRRLELLSKRRVERRKARGNNMDRFKIQGGRRLEGTVRISGAKNAALPAMAAALLTSEPVHLQNIPHVRDIITMAKLLAHMRCRVESPDLPPSEFIIQRGNDFARRGAVRTGEDHARFGADARPAGRRASATRAFRFPADARSARGPIDLHIQALEKMGAKITIDHGYVEARAKRLRGTTFRFPKDHGHRNGKYSDRRGAGRGRNRSRKLPRCEPEVTDLAELLIKMGAKIEGAGTSTIRVQGVEQLHGATHAIIPDRIEAGTFLVAGAITGGELLLTHCEPQHLDRGDRKAARPAASRSSARARAACACARAKKLVRRRRHHRGISGLRHRHAGAIHGAGHAGARASRRSRETIFENRFMHASEMVRMGANITIDGNVAIVHGPTPLSGAPVIASDLRASASLVLAGLVADNTTWIDRVYHIDRGYERIEEKLQALGAQHRTRHRSRRDPPIAIKKGGDFSPPRSNYPEFSDFAQLPSPANLLCAVLRSVAASSCRAVSRRTALRLRRILLPSIASTFTRT